MELLDELQSISKGDSSMSAYLARVKEIVDALAAVNNRISDRKLLSHIVHGLPDDFDHITSIIINQTPTPLFHEARKMLLNAEVRLRRRHNISAVAGSPSPVAFYTQHTSPAGGPQSVRSNSGGQGNSNSSGGGCWVFKKKGGAGSASGGHTGQPRKNQNSGQIGSTRGVFGSSPGGWTGSNHTFPPGFSAVGSVPPFSAPNPVQMSVVYQICLVYGHSALSCPHRMNFAYTAQDPARAFSTMSLQDNSDNSWYLDSAATAYMTNDKVLGFCC